MMWTIEAEELKQESYGVELLQTVGFVYARKSQYVLPSPISLRGLISRPDTTLLRQDRFRSVSADGSILLVPQLISSARPSPPFGLVSH